MSQSNWTVATGSLSSPDCAKGVTSMPVKPNGGGSFVYAMHTLTNTPGAVALYTNQLNFAPMAKGCDITGALKRAVSGGPTGFSCFLFCGLGGTSLGDDAYILGLSDGDPCHIELRKGPLSIGLPDEAVGGVNKILARSTEAIPIDTWQHLRLEQVVNDNGDVILNCRRSDLGVNAVGSPVWAQIPGMVDIIDDFAGIATGSPPLTSGRAGFGGAFSDVSRRVYFDHLTIARQT